MDGTAYKFVVLGEAERFVHINISFINEVLTIYITGLRDITRLYSINYKQWVATILATLTLAISDGINCFVKNTNI